MPKSSTQSLLDKFRFDSSSGDSRLSDLQASFVVFLVALPLAMGIAIASGYPPVAGIITGVIGGIVVGAISGAPLQVSGAAAGLTVLVLQGVQTFGLQQMGAAILLAGLIQVIGGFAKLGRWFQAASPTAVLGMLSGIGLLIVVGQFHVMLDLPAKGGGLQNIRGIPDSLVQTFSASGMQSVTALALGVLTISVMIFWPKLGKGVSAKIPAPLAAVAAAAVVAAVLKLQVNFVTIPSDLFSNWVAFDFDLSKAIANPALLALGIQIALIASAESLLCAAATDQMHHGDRANFDRELLSQGVGNVLCGILGVLPMTGVIVRSSANVQAGAKTRLSAILHGVWLMVFVLLLPMVLSAIPTAALAGLLVYTGVKLINIKVIGLLYRRSKAELGIFAATAVTVVTVDLLFGVMLGLALAGVKLFHSLSELHVTTEPGPTGDHLVIDLRGAATFVRLPKLTATLESLPRGSNITFRSRDLHLVDHACIDHLVAWRKRHERSGGTITEEGSAIFSAAIS